MSTSSSMVEFHGVQKHGIWVRISGGATFFLLLYIIILPNLKYNIFQIKVNLYLYQYNGIKNEALNNWWLIGIENTTKNNIITIKIDHN